MVFTMNRSEMHVQWGFLAHQHFGYQGLSLSPTQEYINLNPAFDLGAFRTSQQLMSRWKYQL